MSIKFESVSISPSNTVQTGQQFLLSVRVQVSTYERLKSWMHRQLTKFTHRNLAEDLLT